MLLIKRAMVLLLGHPWGLDNPRASEVETALRRGQKFNEDGVCRSKLR